MSTTQPVESEPGTTGAATPEQTSQEPAPPEAPARRGKESMWRPIVRLFSGEYTSLVAVSASSFIGGLCEATLLVLIANLALTIGGGDLDEGQTGVLSFGSFDKRSLFLLALALTAGRLLVQYLASRLAARTIARLTQRIRLETFDAYVHASWELQAAESEASVQDLLLRHVAKAQAALVTFSLLLGGLFMVSALVGSAFLVDPISAALIIVVGLLLFVGLRPLTVKGKRLAKRQVAGGLLYNVQSREAVELSLEIRAFGVNDQIAERLDAATELEITPLYRSQLITRMMGTLYSSAAILILLLALVGLDTFLDRPLASIGAIVVVLIRALNQTSGIQTAFHNLSEFVPFIERIEEERARFRASRQPSGSVVLDGIGAIRFEIGRASCRERVFGYV